MNIYVFRYFWYKKAQSYWKIVFENPVSVCVKFITGSSCFMNWPFACILLTYTHRKDNKCNQWLIRGHLSWPTPWVENWPTPRVVNWPTLSVVNWPTLFQRVVNWPTEKLEVGLHQYWRRPISSSSVVSWPTKNCKLVYTILCVGQLQVWGLEIGLPKTASWPTMLF